MLANFEYFEPRSAADAVQLLSKHAGRVQIVAGGLDLIPRMRVGRITADAVVNLANIPGLASMETSAETGLKFGAMATLFDLERSAYVQENYPILYEAVHSITSVQTKHMGTLVGNICVSTPASDLTPVLLVLDASVDIMGPHGLRTERMEDFLPDYGKTSLKAGEYVAAVSIPAKGSAGRKAHKPLFGIGSAPGKKAASGTGFIKLIRNHADIAKLNAAAAVTLEQGVCRDAKIAVGAAAPIVFRAKQAEQLLVGQTLDDSLIERAAQAASAEAKPIDDYRSTAEYRKATSAVLVRRVLKQALERANAETVE